MVYGLVLVVVGMVCLVLVLHALRRDGWTARDAVTTVGVLFMCAVYMGFGIWAWAVL